MKSDRPASAVPQTANTATLATYPSHEFNATSCGESNLFTESENTFDWLKVFGVFEKSAVIIKFFTVSLNPELGENTLLVLKLFVI
jgi:hypothetical protein